jgi:tRNA/tmRNA/rRNA uracil-C5-methylase (TrmA/RlmC/RlmD family)
VHTTGDELELEVGAPAHGGFCVAREGEDGRVCFVSHALPGERVRARVTEDRGGNYFRADAIEILVASPDRVSPPCPHAGPGRCGGCDWQHARGEAQRRIKEAVVREQFRRLARTELPEGFSVEPLPAGSGQDELLGWRTRVTYAVDRDGRPGLHKHRSTELEYVDNCPLGVPGVGDSDVLTRRWAGLTGIGVVAAEDGTITRIAHRPGAGRQSRGRRPPDRLEVIDGAATLRYSVAGQDIEVAATGFWQVHPHALRTFTQALLEATAPRPGERVLDLYSGAGALTAALADAVGATGEVLGIESDARAVADAVRNLEPWPWARVTAARIDDRTADSLFGDDRKVDVIVLDPPRAGAGQAVMRALVALAPRVIGYVACDPAALARDAAVAFAAGWRLGTLRAFDAFPMTHHVECVASFVREQPGSDSDEGLTTARRR